MVQKYLTTIFCFTFVFLYLTIAQAKEFIFGCVEEKTLSQVENLTSLEDYYPIKLEHLKKNEGVKFFPKSTSGKWGWAGMPVEAFWKNKMYCVSEENIGFFFKPIQTKEEAYELVTFLPRYWKFDLKSARADADGFLVQVSAMGMNGKTHTTFTYKVYLNNTYEVVGNTNPKADATEGIYF